MKTFGTVDEWLALKPDAILTNHTLMDPGMYAIQFVEKRPERFQVSRLTFQSHGYDRQTFNGCGYVKPQGELDSVQYACSLITAMGSGGNYALTDETANDPNWTESELYK
jgi:hypothetical protein